MDEIITLDIELNTFLEQYPDMKEKYSKMLILWGEWRYKQGIEAAKEINLWMNTQNVSLS